MAAIAIIVSQADYNSWRAAFDDHEDFRVMNGMTSSKVHVSPDDRNRVVVVGSFDSVEAAKTFASLPDLAQAMKDSGVVGPPEITFAEVV
jgi:quinol monooxygenase YgiN